MPKTPKKTRNPNFVHAIAVDVSKDTILVRGASSVSTGAMRTITTTKTIYYYELSTKLKQDCQKIVRDSVMPDDQLSDFYRNGYRVYNQYSYSDSNTYRLDETTWNVETVRHIGKKYNRTPCSIVVKRGNHPIGAMLGYMDNGTVICINPLILLDMLGFRKDQITMNSHYYSVMLNNNPSTVIRIPRHSVKTSNNKTLVLEQVACREVFNVLKPHLWELRLEWSINSSMVIFTLSKEDPPRNSRITVYDAVTRSITSFEEIGSDIYEGVRYWGQYAYDSPSDFLKTVAVDTPKEIYFELKESGKKLVDSPSDFFDSLVDDMVDTYKSTTNPEILFSKEHWLDISSFIGVFIGASRAGRTVVKGASKAAPTAGGVTPKKRIFTSPDKYVAETANAIEARFPGRVIDVNKDVYRPNGTKLTDFDIELDNIVIQVKSGTGEGLTRQMVMSSTGTEKIVIGYTPNLNPSSHLVRNAKRDALHRTGMSEGFDVFTDLEELLKFLENH